MDKPDKGETLFSVVFVSIVIGEIAVVGAALWRASGCSGPYSLSPDL